MKIFRMKIKFRADLFYWSDVHVDGGGGGGKPARSERVTNSFLSILKGF